MRLHGRDKCVKKGIKWHVVSLNKHWKESPSLDPQIGGSIKTPKTTENYRKQPKTTENNRKLPKTTENIAATVPKTTENYRKQPKTSQQLYRKRQKSTENITVSR